MLGTKGACPLSPEPPLPETGRLGEYELLQKRGEGGMGAVFKARQVRLDKIVALKVLSRQRTGDPRAVARFEREMKAIGRLSHPNIVQAYDARDIDGATVLVMEYVDGLDLAKLIPSRRGGKGDRPHLPERPKAGEKGDRLLLPERAEGCLAQKVPVPILFGTIIALALMEGKRAAVRRCENDEKRIARQDAEFGTIIALALREGKRAAACR